MAYHDVIDVPAEVYTLFTKILEKRDVNINSYFYDACYLARFVKSFTKTDLQY